MENKTCIVTGYRKIDAIKIKYVRQKIRCVIIIAIEDDKLMSQVQESKVTDLAKRFSQNLQFVLHLLWCELLNC